MRVTFRFFYLPLIILSAFLLFSGCASTASSSKTAGLLVAGAPSLQNLPEINSVKAYPLPPKDLPGISYSVKLSESPAASDIKNISVLSTSIYTWKPEEVFTDIYVYEKASGKYVACIKNCYTQAIQKGQWGQMGTFWYVWAKDDAVYLISPSAYVLCTKDGLELISGYLAETAFPKVRIFLGELGWQPEGETADFYLYSKKEEKYVACIKDCWQQGFATGLNGWNGLVKNACRLITTDGKQYYINSSDYIICNEDGYEYINSGLVKTEFDNLFLFCQQTGWQPEGDTRDYYLYSKKQKKIVTCIKDCWQQAFTTGLNGWNGDVKNAYRLMTTDGKQYLAEASDYLICNEDGYEYINGYQYKCSFINSDFLGSEVTAKKGNITVCENPVRELLYICKMLSDCPSLVVIYDDDSYLSDINSYFADFKNHEAVTFIKNNFVSFDKDDLDISLEVYSAAEEQLMSKESEILPCGNEFNYKDFMLLLTDFAKESNFKKFYEAHKNYYEKHIIQNGFNAFESVKKWNEQYLKQDPRIEYTICMHRGEWCNVNYNDQTLKMTINLSVCEGNDSLGLAHELSHPIINPVVQKLYDSVLRPFMDSYFMKNQGSEAVYYYPTAIGYWCDTFARAAAGSYGHTRGSDIQGYTNSQAAIGFTAVPDLIDKLDEFTSLKYKSFDELYAPLFEFLRAYLITD